jgi:hypothetical protein
MAVPGPSALLGAVPWGLSWPTFTLLLILTLAIDLMPDDPKLDDAMRIAAEQAAIISGIGKVTTAWATLEMNLFCLFSVLTGLSEDQAWDECAGVIFYTPTNTETRIALVDNLVDYRCRLRKLPPPAAHLIDERLSTLWSKVKDKIDGLKSTRNAIIHGTVASVGTATKSSVKVMPAFADTLRLHKAAAAQGNIPGLGSNELNVHSQAVWRVNNRVHELTEAFRLRMQLPQLPDSAEAVQKLLELTQQEVQTDTKT